MLLLVDCFDSPFYSISTHFICSTPSIWTRPLSCGHKLNTMASPSLENIFDGPSTPSSSSDYASSTNDSRNTSPSADPPTPMSIGTPASSPVTVKKEPADAEKKPTKKRKSWGQQLPTPTTSLPPRKRAKTAEEKEQRRVERVLRNRAAAQKSRELKKHEYELVVLDRDRLQTENEQFKIQINDLQQRIKALEEKNSHPQLIAGPPTPASEKSIEFTTPEDLTTSFENFPELSLNPNIFIDGSVLDLNNNEIFPLTHQSAVLMCDDLPCQGITSSSRSRTTHLWRLVINAALTTFWSMSLDPMLISLLQTLSSNPKDDTASDIQKRLVSLFWNELRARLTAKTNSLSKEAHATKTSVTASFEGADKVGLVERNRVIPAPGGNIRCRGNIDYGPVTGGKNVLVSA